MIQVVSVPNDVLIRDRKGGDAEEWPTDDAATSQEQLEPPGAGEVGRTFAGIFMNTTLLHWNSGLRPPGLGQHTLQHTILFYAAQFRSLGPGAQCIQCGDHHQTLFHGDRGRSFCLCSAPGEHPVHSRHW